MKIQQSCSYSWMSIPVTTLQFGSSHDTTSQAAGQISVSAKARIVCLKPLADANPNSKFACTWETESSYKYRFCTIFQVDPGWKQQE